MNGGAGKKELSSILLGRTRGVIVEVFAKSATEVDEFLQVVGLP